MLFETIVKLVPSKLRLALPDEAVGIFMLPLFPAVILPPLVIAPLFQPSSVLESAPVPSSRTQQSSPGPSSDGSSASPAALCRSTSADDAAQLALLQGGLTTPPPAPAHRTGMARGLGAIAAAADDGTATMSGQQAPFGGLLHTLGGWISALKGLDSNLLGGL